MKSINRIIKDKVFIIAEAGVNHNGDLNIAMQLVEAAAEIGADAIKFQTFTADSLVCRNAPKADYQMQTTDGDESQYAMIRCLELDENAHDLLIRHCAENNIEFLSSPFDLESISLLARLDLPLFKIPSGEITNYPYLLKIGSFGKPVMLSTGMCQLDEIYSAVEVLQKSGLKDSEIALLHCNTEYPTPMGDVNLKAMLTLKSSFPGLTIGYSDHTKGIEVPIAATALGAKIIEKHFTLDKDMPGPDHKASLAVTEFKSMVDCIRNVEKSMGSGQKKPSPSEIKNLVIARKSLVAATDIKKGETFTPDNLCVKRPGSGISPMKWDEYIGTSASRNYQQDELIYQ